MISIETKWVSREQYLEELRGFSSSDISIYHRQHWLDAISNGFDLEIGFARSIDADQRTLALTPFILLKKGPFHVVGTPISGVYTEFMGPLFIDGLSSEIRVLIIAALHQHLAKSNSYIEWGCKVEPEWGSMLSSVGYQKHKRQTILIDLSLGESAVWASFEGRARNMVRKAAKAGVVARTVQPDEDWILGYYDMLRATFRRQGLAVPHPLSFYKQMLALSNAGIARCMAAEVNGRMIAGSIFLKDDKRMLYLSGVANEEGMTLAATSLLQWHAVKEAIQLGVVEYDMGGLGMPSIDKFKRSFGGGEQVHFRWVYRSRLFGIAEPAAHWAVRKGLLRLGGA